jgi:PAS domain S-box-containing protein
MLFPLISCFAPRQRQLSLILAVIVLIGAVLSLAVYVYSDRAERIRLEAEFGHRADVRNALNREVISNYNSGVYVLKSLFEGSESVSREEFRHVASDILARYPGITALEWVPRVPGSARAAVEASLSTELNRPMKFTEAVPNGTMATARDRGEHYPILYVEPMAGNERVLGYDIQNAPTAPFLRQARETGRMVASSQFQLVQQRLGIVVIWPVRKVNAADPSADNFAGFVQGVFRVREMLETTIARSPATGLEMLYIDDTATDPSLRVLYHTSPKASPTSEDGLAVEEDYRRGLHREYPIEFGGRRWVVIYRPTPQWLAQQNSHLAFLWLLVGLLVTALVAGLVKVMARRNSAIQREVEERTTELNESRRHLSSLLHALPGMAYRCLYRDKLSVVYVSEGVLNLTGYRADQFTSEEIHFRDLINPHDLTNVRAATRQCLKTGCDVEVEYRIRPRTGPEKWLLSRGRGVYNERHELLFFEGLAIDVTARKQAEVEKISMERKLLESQKLESLGLLAGGIAHDFNNLLTGMMGHANLARFHAGVDPEITDHLRKIEGGATRAAELCQQMLAYSGRGNFVIEPVDLNRLIRETVPLLQGSLPSRSRLELRLVEEATVVMADATQLRQIAMNLILNAADALGATGGDVIVTTGRRTFGVDFLAAAHAGEGLLPGPYNFLEVRDTGCGMSPDTMAKIFDPFFTTKFTGRGLGLAAVLGIVRGHSGALRVQSELGRGSTFTFILPPSRENLSRRHDSVTSTPWQRSGKVLVIDDEESVRNVAAALLKTFGLAAVTASNGQDGIDRFRENPGAFDLVLLDLTMPGLDGEETLTRLRAITPDVRVVVVSGYSETDRIGQLAAGGPLLFLQKPFTRGSLEQKLQEILSGQTVAS